MRRRAAIFGLAAAATVAMLLTSASAAEAKGRIEPEPVFTLPSTAAGCGGATALAGGAEQIPITVSTVAGQVAETTNLCFGTKGPYPFVIDTGAGQSTIDAHLARILHLAKAGPAEQLAGVGCTGPAQPVAVNHWSVDGVALAAQGLTAATLPDIGRKGEPMGLLGSDVMSRFGAVRLDFVAQTLTFGGPEGPIPNGASEVKGPIGPPPPAVLTPGPPGITVPITVSLVPGAVDLNVPLRFGHGSVRSFVVDTGSSQSVMATQAAKAQKLAPSNLAQRQSTVCSVITVPLVHTGAWSIPGVSLAPQLIGTTGFGPISTGGTQGLLGSDQLKRFGWVVFDYAGGRLVVG